MRARFHTLRLLADDMTGALDSAAAFVRLFGPLDVGTTTGASRSCVLDSETRELPCEVAAKRVDALAAHLAPEAGRLSFFKVDSLLRGHAGAELAMLLSRQAFDHIILAPAMPFQGRVTRGGQQQIHENGVWQATGEDLARSLRDAGLAVHHTEAGAPLLPGITLMDAASEADLDAIVAAGLATGGSTLWVGSGGLAGALARGLGGRPASPPPLSGPVLGLVGSHHPVMLGQLRGVAAWHIEISDAEARTRQTITDGMVESGATFVTCALPEEATRAEAQARIETLFADLTMHMQPPGLLFVSGGETLRALLAPLEASHLTVFAEIEPGAPLSRIVGGRWNGVHVLSKSGAFGAPDFLETLIYSLNDPQKAVSS